MVDTEKEGKKIINMTIKALTDVKVDLDYNKGVRRCAVALARELLERGGLTELFVCDMLQIKNYLDIGSHKAHERLTEKYKDVIGIDERDIVYAWRAAWMMFKSALIMVLVAEGLTHMIRHEGV